ncbi:hypothetical protein AMTR_s00023p00129920 [Amborella trichopoda]|uniref:Uncharacterized protein n=1 Tax=Amborella trichopoda TaxID=13333 RepID=W1NK78_AMBTC|nr:hypothetical protein AMTR_s00023p00129920 [Amborella trichopoda]
MDGKPPDLRTQVEEYGGGSGSGNKACAAGYGGHKDGKDVPESGVYDKEDYRAVVSICEGGFGVWVLAEHNIDNGETNLGAAVPHQHGAILEGLEHGKANLAIAAQSIVECGVGPNLGDTSSIAGYFGAEALTRVAAATTLEAREHSGVEQVDLLGVVEIGVMNKTVVAPLNEQRASTKVVPDATGCEQEQVTADFQQLAVVDDVGEKTWL